MDLVTNLFELLMISALFVGMGAVIRTKTVGVRVVRPQREWVGRP